ncbi:MAG: hypothetical protein HY015_04850 [Bacteroidetes bacterium]|nr:hypothetical protein [Bacteroidota bacterium]MBI3482289.1 hypothetical protein [Bacteroidota bacterium]
MVHLKKFGVLLLLFTVISCTIVKDSDVTSIDQFNKFKLKSFEIDQSTSSGSSSALATLKYDSVQNIISKISGYHITRLVAYSLPPLGTKKMQLRSETNLKTDLLFYYRDDGLPITLFILAGDSLVESYRFYYNSLRQLAKVVTDIDPIDNKPETIHYRDTIIYPSSTAAAAYPSSIKRNSPYDASMAGTFTFTPCSTCPSSSTNRLSNISFAYPSNLNQPIFQLYFNTGGCDNSSEYYPYQCGGVSKNNSTGGGGSSNSYQLSFRSDITFNKTISTSLTSASVSDAYYFHPLMILKDAIPQGSLYFWFYSIDWFQTTGNSLSNSDVVKINFNYGK